MLVKYQRYIFYVYFGVAYCGKSLLISRKSIDKHLLSFMMWQKCGQQLLR